VVNQKSGVGKTTTSVNSPPRSGAPSAACCRRSRSQGNATMGSGVDKRAITRSVYHVLLGPATSA
jgi:chromosome partitioning protein